MTPPPDRRPRRALLVLATVALTTVALAACGDSGAASLGPDVSDLVPQCDVPAPLAGQYDARAPGYIVLLRDSTDVEAGAGRLADRYHFTVEFVYDHVLFGFATRDASRSAIAALRCDRAVKRLEHDAPVYAADRAGGA